MATFTVNGKTVTTDKNQKLLRYLRDELRLTSVKDGCSEGACGTCTVLVDGKATKACVFTTDKMDGKTVLTVEGLEALPLGRALQQAFANQGAVQCGFCTPGMLLSAYALLLRERNPSEEMIRIALAGNLCRCTGYAQIIAAVQAAAREVLS